MAVEKINVPVTNINMKFNFTYILQFEMIFPYTISKSPGTYLDQQHSAFIILSIYVLRAHV